LRLPALLLILSGCAQAPPWPEVVNERTLTLRGHDQPIVETYLSLQTGNGFVRLTAGSDTLLEAYARDWHEDGALADDMSAKIKPNAAGDRSLSPVYSDLDGDGHDDLTLSGTVEVGWEDRVVREEPCVVRFLWRPDAREFREDGHAQAGCSVYAIQYD
jgi:hypothetical protein